MPRTSFGFPLFACVTLSLLGAAGCGEKPSVEGDAGVIDSPVGGSDAGSLTDGGTTVTEDGGVGEDGGSEPAEVTWYEHVLPIAQRSCQGCHVEGGIGPFALTSYATAQTHAEGIADAVAQRRMPPWKADEENCRDLKHSKSLPQSEIDTIVAWAAGGAKEGDPLKAPPPRVPPPGLEWVDVTLDPGEDYAPRAQVTDDYRCFIVSPSPTSTKDVIGFEVLPGTPSQVHHVILFAVPAAEAQAADDGEEGLGWTCYGSTGTPEQNVRMIGGWAPGGEATRMPATTGVRIQPGTAFVTQVHYNLAAGNPQPDRTRVALQYSKQSVSRPATIFPLASQSFQIPPQSTGYTSKGTFALPSFVPNATLWGITPHMHGLGTKIRVRNVTNGACLVDVPKWDFHWQASYEFEQSMPVAGGQTFEIECTWDNPTDRTVTWGEGTADEMCIAFVYATVP